MQTTQRSLPLSLRVLTLSLSLLLLVPATVAQRGDSCCGAVSANGQKLAAALDGMNVESLWLAEQHVNWESGEPDRGADYEGPGRHTHCSAFAASAAKRLGVYLLRPPEHGQLLLANAQAEWLASREGRSHGWSEISNAHDAQAEANRGNLVLVVYANPNSHEPGHIAIVRPSEKSQHELQQDGPQIIQAGQHNHASTVVRIGFHNHPGAWPDGVRYYEHAL